jgi:hypothetical protein
MRPLASIATIATTMTSSINVKPQHAAASKGDDAWRARWDEARRMLIIKV